MGRATGVLAHKAARGRTVAPQPLAMTPPRALALALSRVADAALSLPLRVAGVQARNLSLSDLPEAIMDQALIAVVEGPGEGLGIVALCPATVASLIEVQTMGRLSHRAVVARRPTRTDAALAAPFLDAVLEGFEGMLDGLTGQDWAAGYRYASFLDDPRPLGLMLEDGALRGLVADLVMGADGQRQGHLLVALPAQPRRADPARAAPPSHPAAQAAQAAADRAARRWTADLEDRVLGAEVALTGVLARLRLPASRLMALAPGAMLALPDAAARALTLETGGRVVAAGRLGQHRGARAVRLNGAAAPGVALPTDALAMAMAGAAPPQAVPDPPDPPVAMPQVPDDLPALPMPFALDEGDHAALAPLPMKIGAFG